MAIVSCILCKGVEARIVEKLTKGTIITCPKDNAKVLILKKDINLFSNYDLESFSVINDLNFNLTESGIPCEAIKESCFHLEEGWVGFSSECALIPRNAGQSFKEFMEQVEKRKNDRKEILSRDFDCKIYNKELDVELCISKDKKFQCLKSSNYPTLDGFGPCSKYP